MPKAIMFVQSRPSAADREDKYNDWYTNTHIPEVLDIPGITRHAGSRRVSRAASRARTSTTRCTSSSATT